eukprot:8176226-Alexandrium_andersonii.AAC.1
MVVEQSGSGNFAKWRRRSTLELRGTRSDQTFFPDVPARARAPSFPVASPCFPRNGSHIVRVSAFCVVQGQLRTVMWNIFRT